MEHRRDARPTCRLTCAGRSTVSTSGTRSRIVQQSGRSTTSGGSYLAAFAQRRLLRRSRDGRRHRAGTGRQPRPLPGHGDRSPSARPHVTAGPASDRTSKPTAWHLDATTSVTVRALARLELYLAPDRRLGRQLAPPATYATEGTIGYPLLGTPPPPPPPPPPPSRLRQPRRHPPRRLHLHPRALAAVLHAALPRPHPLRPLLHRPPQSARLALPASTAS